MSAMSLPGAAARRTARLARRHKVITGIVALFIAAVIAVSLATNTSSASPASPNYPAAAGFTLPALGQAGKQISLSQYQGKPVIVNFWASWCEPCKAEAPVLERVQQRLKKNNGTVFGVTYKDAPGASRDFVRQEKATWLNVRDDRLKLAPKYGTSQLPETFVINRAGKVVALSRGQIDQQFMDAALDRAGVPR